MSQRDVKDSGASRYLVWPKIQDNEDDWLTWKVNAEGWEIRDDVLVFTIKSEVVMAYMLNEIIAWGREGIVNGTEKPEDSFDRLGGMQGCCG